METVSLSVRIDKGLHREVRLRAFKEEVAVEALLRGWLRAYAEGSLLADGARVARADGVVKVPVERTVEMQEVGAPLPPREVKTRRPKDGMCEHRVPAGTFCKKCGV